jgi:hypothetical protein
MPFQVRSATAACGSACGRDVWRTAVRLTVINSSYNTRELLSDCLESISRTRRASPMRSSLSAARIRAPNISEAGKLDHFWLEFCAAESPRLGGAEDDEGLEVFGRPEGVHFEARQ